MSPARGTGSIYLRGSTWWLKYYRDGRAFRESARTESYEAAARLLKRRLGQVADGKHVSPRADRVTLKEILDDWIAEQEMHGRRSVAQSRVRSGNLRDHFGDHRRAQTITAADVRGYALARMAAGRKPGTINLELAALKRAFTLGLQGEKVYRAPHVESLPVDNVRKGFFEREAFEAVRRELKVEVLQDIATVGYWIGWRKSELVNLENRQVDLERQCLRLERGVTKGREPRVVYLPAEAWAVIAKWYGRRRSGSIISRYVFHRRGERIGNFEKAWASACKRAGHPGMLFHDLRRTAVRNMVRRGIHEVVVMKITGHRSRRVFDRYNITSEEDLQEAARLLDGHKRGHKEPSGGEPQ